MSNPAKLPKGYRVTVAPCRVVGESRPGAFVAFRVWYNGQIVVSEWSHGLTFESRDKAREAGNARAHAYAAAQG